MDLFGTAGIRGRVADEVTPELALRVGQAVGKPDREFVVGRDGRVTGETLVAALRAGLQSAGASVRTVGIVPTPTLAFASQGRYGVQVTASHNPPADNGIKLFEDGTEFDRQAEQAVSDRVADGSEQAPWDQWGETERIDVLDAYQETVTEYVRGRGLPESHPVDAGAEMDSETPLAGTTIAVDCGNGMGALGTPQLLEALGANVVTINGTVDGHFPGRASKPTPETLAEFRHFVADNRTEFGIAHDGDADRVVLVDGDGTVVHEDTVVAILAEYYVRASEVADPIVVTTPNASGRIDQRVEAAGGTIERVRLGALHEGIAEASGTVVFAAEPWKHIHPRLGRWIDGIASAGVLSVLITEAGGLEALRGPVTERPYRKVSVPCAESAKEPAMEQLETTLPEAFPAATVSTEYGVRLAFEDGSWTLVRPSGTEPYVRLYAESDEVDDLVTGVRSTIETAISNVSE
ncbi:phosphohexomutase domain-containing protein [Halodesulfurarchaeum formicicum]|uniref:Phosphoglucosamine mutase n=1 Tax=Halodesulfurarchaeum formicicum TaxID=1873524 RepID=A0A1J1AC19_9EURY|nr:phosphomannomutase [Halodesulfurarchaeum formicicum]APE95279.1 phosphoglucosamine mutase [Halodesulfurarchaeum formicicum]